MCRESSGYRNCSRIDRHHLGKRNLHPIPVSLAVPLDAVCVSSLLTGPSEFKQKIFICPANKPTQKTAPLNSKIKAQSSGVKTDIMYQSCKEQCCPQRKNAKGTLCLSRIFFFEVSWVNIEIVHVFYVSHITGVQCFPRREGALFCLCRRGGTCQGHAQRCQPHT